RIAAGMRDVPVVPHDGDAVAVLPVEEPERPLECGAEIRRLAPLGRDPREGGELAHDPGRAHRPVATDGGVLEQLLEQPDRGHVGPSASMPARRSSTRSGTTRITPAACRRRAAGLASDTSDTTRAPGPGEARSGSLAVTAIPAAASCRVASSAGSRRRQGVGAM